MLAWKNPVIAFATNGVGRGPFRAGDCVLDRYGHVGNMAPPSRHPRRSFPPKERPPTERQIGRQGVSMTFSSRPRSLARWTSLISWMVAALALAAAGCA